MQVSSLRGIPFLVGIVFVLILSFRQASLVGIVLGLCVSLMFGLMAIVRGCLPIVSHGTVGFFHPNAEDGGGGERVLWTSMQALYKFNPSLRIVLYTKTGFSAEVLKAKALRSFNLTVETPFEIVPLSKVDNLDGRKYPSFTLLRQAFASVSVQWEGLLSIVPEIYFDTSGWAFTYPITWLAGSKVCCYVHYPTISVDMLSRVRSRSALYNNRQQIANSFLLSILKTLYYEVFSVFYGFCGMFVKTVMVNSSWTGQHISCLWWRLTPPVVVYPPVDTLSLQSLPLDRPLKELFLLSVGQFRPEKDHTMQLKAYHRVLELAQENPSKTLAHRVLSSRLKIVGSCRNEADSERLRSLQVLSKELNLEENVIFLENIPFDELKIQLGNAVGGLHTMVDEHFGICVVEYMAAGLVPIAHNSAGPKMDILSPQESSLHDCQLGFLASTLEEYAHSMYTVLVMEEEERQRIARDARKQAALFSQENFEHGLIRSLRALVQAPV